MDDGAEDESGPERRCILTGETRSPVALIRLVLAPGGEVTPDLRRVLPGRGVWVTADRAALEAAIADASLVKAVSRGFKTKVRAADVPADLGDRIDRLICRSLLGHLGLEKRSGRLVTGFEKVQAALRGKSARMLVQASDGAADGCGKLGALARATEVAECRSLTREELSLALGLENVVHAAVKSGGAVQRIAATADLLALYRGPQGAGSAEPAIRTEDEENV